LTVQAIDAKTVHAPYPPCPQFPDRFGKLVGQRIEPGWTAKVRLLLGGRWGCTHLVELMGPLATTAVQTVYAWRGEIGDHIDDSVAPPADFINTCHTFAAGYDIRTSETYEKTMKEFEKIVGFIYLKGIHLNDSKVELGSRKDRHNSLGKGELGWETFKIIMQDPRLDNMPLILETIDENLWAEEIKQLYSFYDNNFKP
jgi:endonuclease IV